MSQTHTPLTEMEPALQLHVCVLLPTTQVPLAPHGLPSQLVFRQPPAVVPSPVNPGGHVHVNDDPPVSVQVAMEVQGFVAHPPAVATHVPLEFV
jgi:hypothetical protein